MYGKLKIAYITSIIKKKKKVKKVCSSAGLQERFTVVSPPYFKK